MHKEVVLANIAKLKYLSMANKSNEQLHLAFASLARMIKDDEVVVIIDGLPASQVKEKTEGYAFTLIQGKFATAKLNGEQLQLIENGGVVIEFQYSPKTNSWQRITPEQILPVGPVIFN